MGSEGSDALRVHRAGSSATRYEQVGTAMLHLMLCSSAVVKFNHYAYVASRPATGSATRPALAREVASVAERKRARGLWLC